MQDMTSVSVLCVDDEEMLLDLAGKFLERMDTFTVRKASSAFEALSLLASFPYDVIVSDYQMPDMNGIDFLKEVKRLYPDIPFILFTGKGREEVVIEAINNGASFYLQKGGDPKTQFAELAHKIRRAVSQARAEKVLLKNITILKQQEEVIRERENFYRAVFETTGTAMMVIEEDMIISLANAECERMSGYPRSEIEGKKRWTEFVSNEDLPQMLERHRVRRDRAGSAPLHYEFTLIDRAGEQRRIFLTIDLIPGTKRSVASLIDITGRIRAEKALRQSEALHRTIFEISPDPIAMTDERGMLIRVSPSALQLFGLSSADEAIGKPLFDWIEPGFRAEARERVLGFISSSSPTSIASMYPLIRKDGTRFFAEISSSVLRDGNATPIGMLSILRDVTDRVNTENALKRANVKLGLLATTTRHDIVNKLTVLLGYIELAQEKCSPDVLREYLAKIRTAADTVEAQVQVADYENLGTETPRWQNVGTIAGTAFSGLGTDHISFENGCESLEVFTDPLFGNAIYNLIDNALRHGKNLSRIAVRYEKNGPDILLVVEDDGIGIPVGEKEKIFTRGYGKNTGLGLFVVREILGITGMSITETGTSGEGARFTIRIPAGHFRFVDAA
ncbi:MAG: sensory histidine kinase AtoS [Methanoregula sp. PtaU1.Bin051]|nr:MAG: sensory histidine kinase AtoS [Methanoregula sp. PtaU1.Bin051]